MKWYFAEKVYQCSAVENVKGLLRQYFPKELHFGTKVDPAQVRAAVEQLNDRPRERLGWRTPNQELLGIDPDFGLKPLLARLAGK